MPFDGLFLHKMIDEISVVNKCRVNKINQISLYDFLFQLKGFNETFKLLISMHPQYARIQLTNKSYDMPQEPTKLTMFLRKHFLGGVIQNIYQYSSDRVVNIDFITKNEIGDLIKKNIVIEIMGRRSNLIVIENGKILESYFHQSPFENARTIIPGAKYEYPENNKLDAFSLTKDDFNEILKKNQIESLPNLISGISKFFVNNAKINVFETINDLNPTSNLDDYYFTNLLPNGKRYSTLSEMLDDFYTDKDKKNTVLKKSDNIQLFIKKQIEKNENKLEKLQSELLNALNSEIYKLKGELLYANTNLPKANSCKVINYYTNEEITIELDPLLSIKDNATKYFSKYQKAKKAVIHLNKQIELTKEELSYFELLLVQINNSKLNDTLEIRSELEDYGYIKKNTKQKRKSKSINYDTYYFENTTLYVGKNNIQNEYLTHKFAKPNDLWFHVKDAPGSHVILVGEETEETIRAAANLASYYSKYQNSNSVPVDYTKIRYIKKIPKKHACFVSYTNQKTIYIDPNYDLIKKYKNKSDS